MHALLAAIPPQHLPLGFRDAVMRRVAARTAGAWEWMVAAILAAPAIAFLAYQFVDRGQEFAVAMNNVISAASSEAADAFFFVDGLTVLALALLGIASLFAAHATLALNRRNVADR